MKPILQGGDKVPVSLAVLHCAAINDRQFDGFSPFKVFATIDRWHKEKGFTNGFGYHAFVMPDGSVHAGRPFTMIGAHCIEVNRTGSLGILLIESRKVLPVRRNGKWVSGRFDMWFTAAQDRTLRAILSGLAEKSGVNLVRGHNDYAKKLCPGFDVSEWLRERP